MDLHSVQVELPKNGSIFTIVGKEGFFWNDNVLPTKTYGPFLSIYDAMGDYKSMIQHRKLKSRPTSNLLKLLVPKSAHNVIHVDFKTKKRIA